MELDWTRLLCDWRSASPGKSPGPSAVTEFRTHFESDYDRVVYSQPFRRLARKTQVHPMAMNDHVHNRLTHSVEVASVGRSFGRRLEVFLRQRGELPTEHSGEDLAWILMAASVAHDIGNPPFGHAGEYAIRDWSESHQHIVFPADIPISDASKRDVLLFEGNAQGFRMAARSDNELIGYLRLTFATLGTMVKYPWDSSDPRATQTQKYNCFATERDLFAAAFEEMGLSHGGGFVRHPLSFLSEAADDICYRVLDLEDAAEIGLIPTTRIREIYLSFLPPESQSKYQAYPLPVLRGLVIQTLIQESWRVFEENYGSVMHGERTKDLKADFPSMLQDALGHVQNAYAEIFSETEKVTVELGAYKALGRILKALCLAVAAMKRSDDLKSLRFVTRRSLDLAWDRSYVKAHFHESYDWWIHQILDYVSSLTDNYARQMSREIEGT